MDDDIVNRNVRKVLQIQRQPILAAVVRSKQAEFRPGVQQVSVFRIFPNDLDVRIRRQIAGNVVPCLAVICGLKDVGFEVVEHVSFERYVRCATRS